MKLIMEKWNRFLEESNYITLDETGLGPSFLQHNLNEIENLKEESKDADVLSAEELKNLSTQDIRDAYKKLHSKEAIADKDAREDALDLLADKLITDADIWQPAEEIPTNPVTKQFVGNVGNYINDFLGAKVEGVNTNQRQLSHLGKQIQQLFHNEFTPLEREIIRAIFLFTGQNVPAVRNPSGFDETQAELVKYVNDGIRDDFMPTKATYAKAKIILEALQDTHTSNEETIFRGLTLPIGGGKFTPLSDYKVGGTINVGNIVSFTSEARVAMEFAKSSWSDITGVNQDQPFLSLISGKGLKAGELEQAEEDIFKGFPVVLTIPPGKLIRGVDVDEFSEFEQGEYETISSGNFKITDMGFQIGMSKFKMGFNNFEDVLKAIKNSPHGKHWKSEANRKKGIKSFLWRLAYNFKVVVQLEQVEETVSL